MEVDVDYDHGPADAERPCELYGQQSWWEDRAVEAVRRALAHSDEAVALRTPDGELVASTRVLTDYAVYARICDVIVDEAHRGRGLGHTLIDSVTAIRASTAPGRSSSGVSRISSPSTRSAGSRTTARSSGRWSSSRTEHSEAGANATAG